MVALISGLLFGVGGLIVWLSVDFRGPAPEATPVLIGEPEPETEDAESEPVALPDEVPEGDALEALVAQAVPAPSMPTAVPTPSAEPRADAPDRESSAMASVMRRPSRPSRPVPPERQPSEPVPAPWTPDTAQATPERPEPDPAPPSSSSSSYTATTFGPAARRVVGQRYIGDVQACFDSADRRSPGFSGTVLMSYMLLEDGRVASARVARNTTGDDELGRCLSGLARSWQLPPPPPRTLQFSMSFAR